MGLFKKKITRWLDCNNRHTYFYWKGRVALYALLKAMRIQSGDEVILPAYTCVVVPNTILYLGAKPVYVDVCQETFNMEVKLVEDAITERTKAIICQNTYGLSSSLEELIDTARKHNLFTIEDCTHGFGGYYQGQLNGSYCDAAFFSTQWNKPFSTGLGGFLITQHSEIAEKLHLMETDLIQPSFKELLILKLLYFVKRYILTDSTYWFLVKTYRNLSKMGLVVGSSTGGEIASTQMPEGYFKAFSETQAKEGIRNLKNLPEVLETRKSIAKIYTEFLKRHGKNHVPEKLFADHAFLKYPLLVEERDKFLQLAEQAKISLGDWFTSPLHPVQENLSDWQFDPQKFPNAVYLAKHVVNLPTTPKDSRKILAFLEKNLEHII